MAMIKCPECGNGVSDKATTCSSCGVIIENSKNEAVGISAIKGYEYTPQKDYNDKFWNSANIVSLVGIATMIIGLFLPLVKCEIDGYKLWSKSMMDGKYGVIILILLGLSLLFLILRKNVAYSILGILCIIVTIVEIVNLSKKLDEIAEYSYAQRGIGFTILIISVIILGISEFLQVFGDY